MPEDRDMKVLNGNLTLKLKMKKYVKIQDFYEMWKNL